MSAAAAPSELRVRQAAWADLDPIFKFFLANESPAFPLPGYTALANALLEGRVLVVQPKGDDLIIATAALFTASPAGSPTYVGELAGLCVRREWRGLKPVSLALVLLGLCLCGHAALERTPAGPGATNSLHAFVRRENAASIRNLEAIGMRCSGDLPEWMQLDAHAWQDDEIGSDWLYYVADNGTIVSALDTLVPRGLFDGVLPLVRIDPSTHDVASFDVRIELPHLDIAAQDLEDIRNGDAEVDLVPPPDAFLPPTPP